MHGGLLLLRVVPKPLGSGGFGTVFEIEGRADLLFKVDRDLLLAQPTKTSAVLQRERAYLDHVIAKRSPALAARTAWPIARGRTLINGRSIEGIVLPRVRTNASPGSKRGNTAPALLDFFNAGSRKNLFPDASWRDSFTVARDIALAVHAVHAAGFVHADINHRNVLIDGQFRPTLIDTDSVFDLRHALSPVRVVYGEDYRAPEIKQIAGQRPTEAHDRFALATLIFKVLMQGHSPFAAQQSPDEPDVALEDMVRLGNFTATRRRRDEVPFDPPLSLPPLSCLPDPIAALFECAFDPKRSLSRPSAAEWARELDTARLHLLTCPQNPLHQMVAGRACVWCRFDKRNVAYYLPPRRFKFPQRVTRPSPQQATPPLPSPVRGSAQSTPTPLSLVGDIEGRFNSYLRNAGLQPWPSAAIRVAAGLCFIFFLSLLSMCGHQSPHPDEHGFAEEQE